MAQKAALAAGKRGIIMGTLNRKPLLMLALVLALNCDNAHDTPIPGGEDTAITVADIDTLCRYSMVNATGRPRPDGTFAFRRYDQLTSFLDSTGYDENDTNWWTKKMTHQPDFKKWAYFAFAGNAWPYTIDSIMERKDTLIMNYTRYVPPKCGPPYSGCVIYEPSLPNVDVYFIQFTKKAIAFAEITKSIEEFYKDPCFFCH